MAAGAERLREMQERLTAQARWSVLLILQGMDTSGKDGAIAHVMTGVNPQGCRIVSFKAPSATDLRHDFLWRCARELPERGIIGIFNRSYYEEVLVVRVHRPLLDRQMLPESCMTDDLWEGRYESIRHFEKHLARNGTAVVKCMLHISRDEQKKRLLHRIDEPTKNWKFDGGDVAERQRWDDYMQAYQAAIAGTACAEAPWYVVPADHKWFARLAITEILATRLERIGPAFPTLDEAARADMQRVRAQLCAES